MPEEAEALRINALSHTLRALAVGTSKSILYVSALLGIAAIVPGLEWTKILAPLVGQSDAFMMGQLLTAVGAGIGTNVIASIIDRVASGKPPSDDEIRQEVEQALRESKLDELLTADSFFHAFSQLRRSQRVIQHQGGELLRVLSGIETTLSQDRSSVSSQSSVKIGGDVRDSIIVAASGNAVIHVKQSSTRFEPEALRRLYLENLVSQDPAARMADQRVDLEASQLDVEAASSNHPGIQRDLIEIGQEYIASRMPLLILGEPGSGKTTTLERLVYACAHKALDDRLAPVPILIPLNRFAGNLKELLRSLVSEISEVALDEDSLHSFLSKSNPVFMFDGVNELAALRAIGVRESRNIAALYGSKAYIATCRTSEYANDFEFDEAWQIQGLSDRSIALFLKGQLGPLGGRLYSQIRGDQRLLALARRPMLLKMVASLGTSGRIPSNRGMIYREFIRKILWRENRKGEQAHGIPGSIKQRVLEQLGLEMTLKGLVAVKEDEVRQSFQVYLQQVEEPFNWRQILEELTNNGLLCFTGDIYTFWHQSAQEYFAALAIERQGLLTESLQLLVQKVELHEVIGYLAGITAHSTKLVSFIAKQDPFLAANCILQGAEPSDECVREVVTSIGDQSTNENWAVKRSCADMLGRIRSEHGRPYLIPLLQDVNLEVRWGAIYAIRALGNSAGLLNELLPLLTDPDPIVRGEAVMTLGEIGAAEAISPISDQLASDKTYVRGSAAYAVVKLWPMLPPGIANRLLLHPNAVIRTLTRYAKQVAEHGGDSAFLTASLEGTETPIREAAIFLLVRSQTFDATAALAALLHDEQPSIRGSAIAAIGKLGGDVYVDDAVRLMLFDDDSLVKQNAIRALQWLQAREATPFLLQAAKDADPAVRGLAAQVLGLFGDVIALPTLRSLIVHDADDFVRSNAVRALGFVGLRSDVTFLQSIRLKESSRQVAESMDETIDNLMRRQRRIWQ